MTNSWTTEQDMPSGRLRIIAYSPKKGVEWSARWQDTQEEPLEKVISTIVETLQASQDHILKLMIAEDAAEARRKKERAEEWERYERREDARKVAQALSDSRQQLAETIEKWGKATAVERFFADAEERLTNLDIERRQRLEERLKLARAMMGSIDPLDFIENWQAPDERYRSKYREE
jgi:transcription initiation factor IIE alpha subunit